MKNQNITTQIIHSGIVDTGIGGCLSMPLFFSSSFYKNEVDEIRMFEYSRTNNPTRLALENSIALLEGGKYGVCFSSGLAAIHSVLTLLKTGDEIIIDFQSYRGTLRLLKSISSKYGIRIKRVNLDKISDVANCINSKTKIIWIETPSNPLLKIYDIKAIASLSSPEILVVADNTFATPYFQKPLKFGADIVIHSASKYLGGHSDAILGAVICNNPSTFDELKFCQNTFGSIPGPMDCFLVLRGLKTLEVRMEKHQKNAIEVAKFLAEHDFVKNVFYPGRDERNKIVINEQMKGWGGVVTFSLYDNDIDVVKTLVNTLSLFKIAESLGGVESLVNIPSLTSFKEVTSAEKSDLGLENSVIRLSVGIENSQDLVDDLKNAFSRCESTKHK